MRTTRSHGRLWAAFLLFSTFGWTALLAQGQGALQGTVSDASRGAIPGVTVTITDQATQIKREGITNEIGFYSFPRLPLGLYAIQAALPGFKQALARGVPITVDKTTVVDLTLEVGEIQEQVVVTGVAEKVVETTSATISNVVGEQKINDLPLNGRDWAQLSLLQTGTAPVVNTGAYSDVQGFGGFVNGTRTYQNQASIDGIDFNDPVVPGGPAVPELGGGSITMDAIEEFRVSTAAADAEFGVTAGAQINVVSKRGSNKFHGTVFEYFRNDVLDARNFFDFGAKKPPFRRNQFGFTLGGPILRDKTFFFGSYEGWRQRLFSSRIPGVPTPRLMAAIPGGAANGFLKEVMQAYYPAPSSSFAPDALVAQFFGFQNNRIDRDQYSIRIDHNIGGKHDIMGRYLFLDSSGPPGSLSTSGLPHDGTSFLIRTYNVGLTHTWAISGSTINQLRVGYMRNVLFFGGPEYPPGITELGFSSDRNSGESFPSIGIGGTGLASISTSNTVSSGRAQGTYHIQDTYSFTRGRHSMKGGLDYRYVQDNEVSLSRRRSASFLGFGKPFDNAANGITTALVRSQSQRFFVDPKDGNRYLTLPHLAFYFNDNFKVTPTLTWNLGLRWELVWPLGEKFGNYNNIYPLDSGGSPVEDGAISDISRIGVVPINQFRTTVFDKNNFAPRIGFSWDPFGTAKTAVRGSYSVFFDQVSLVGYRGGGTNPPFIIDTSVSNIRYGFFADPKVHGRTPNLTGINPDNRVAYVQYFTFGVQRETLWSTVVDVNYVATKGTRLDRQWSPNFGAAFRGTRPNPNYVTIGLTEANANSIYHSLQVEVNRPLRKGFQIQTSYTWSKAIDDASDQRSYIPQFQYNMQAERGLADFDVRHNLVVNYAWQLPFGRGQRFLTDAGGAANALLGGWMVTGITQIASGAPNSLQIGVDQNGDGFTNDRPIFIGSSLDQLKADGNPDKTIYLRDPGKLLRSDPNAGPYTTTGRNVIIGPGIVTFDMAFMKRTMLTEGLQFEFQGSLFNIFNHAVFDISQRRTPSFPNVSSPLFGQILRTRIHNRQVQLSMKLRW